MILFKQKRVDVVFHGEAACPFGVVPFKVDAGIFGSCPVRGDFVM